MKFLIFLWCDKSEEHRLKEGGTEILSVMSCGSHPKTRIFFFKKLRKLGSYCTTRAMSRDTGDCVVPLGC